VTNANFGQTTSSGFTKEQLYSTASYQQKNLQGIGLDNNDLTGWDFSGQVVIGATFIYTRGFTKEQLYSTASYQQKNLQGIRLGNDLTGWNFSGQNLVNAFVYVSNLTNANFAGADLTNAHLGAAEPIGESSTLTNANLAGANLTAANLNKATLTNADLTGAIVTGARFNDTTSRGFTKEQLYSTASYQQKNLQGIALASNELTGWDFSGQNLTNADLSRSTLTNVNLSRSTLTNVNLSGAVVTGADLRDTTSRGFTKEQLYSTASYQAQDLRGIGLAQNDLSGWNLAGLNLAGASFDSATLTSANLNGANLTNAILAFSRLNGANLTDTVVKGSQFQDTTRLGFTKEQLYSTASYKQKDLEGTYFWGENDFTGWNFAGLNLSGARFDNANLTNADLTDALVKGAGFGGIASRFTKEQLYSTASYKNKDLGSIWLQEKDLTGWDFSGQNLTNAYFHGSTLTNADLTDAVVRGAKFYGSPFAPQSSKISKEQLYSTASYKTKDLAGIALTQNDLSGWNLAGQNLANASFDSATLTSADLNHANLAGARLWGATLTNADFSFADLRGVDWSFSKGAPILRNTILPDGAINGLDLAAGETLIVYPGVPIPLKINGGFSIAAGATLDLTEIAAIVDYTGDSPVAVAREEILSGRGGPGIGGPWTGTGITSSTAATANQAAPDSRSIGYAENATMPLGAYTTFHGAAVDSTSILIAYTRTGDANLDGVVNADDVTIVGATYAPGVPQPSWAFGDFDYNGFVDDDDVTLLGVFYDPSAPPLNSPAPGAGRGLQSSVSAIPEPPTAVLALLLFVFAAIANRRRLRRRGYGD
jgi:uncharacterized protein YjbI with pentapeptide repeats